MFYTFSKKVVFKILIIRLTTIFVYNKRLNLKYKNYNTYDSKALCIHILYNKLYDMIYHIQYLLNHRQNHDYIH